MMNIPPDVFRYLTESWQLEMEELICMCQKTGMFSILRQQITRYVWQSKIMNVVLIHKKIRFPLYFTQGNMLNSTKHKRAVNWKWLSLQVVRQK